VPQGSAVFPVDEMELRAGGTRNCFIAPLTLSDLLLEDISLHIHAGIWTTKDDEISHPPSLRLCRQLILIRIKLGHCEI
jgi:hypothetical protein